MVSQVEKKRQAVSFPLVLIVEDEIGLLELFSSLLKRLKCETLTAHGGAAALDFLARYTPDVLVLDLAMPDVDGFDVLHYVRSQSRLDDMQILILTARPGLVPDLEELGVDCWVTKPVMPNEFLGLVGDLLSRR